MSDYIKLEEAPTLSLNAPDCNTCAVGLDSVDYGWGCPSCGTFWSYNDGEDNPGTLYEAWSGETLDGPTLTEDQAWQHAASRERERHAASLAKLMKGRPE